MKTNLLLPHCYQRIGWIMLLPAFVLGVILQITGFEPPDIFEIPVFAIADLEILGEDVWFGLTENNILDEVITLLLIAGALLVVFSKERTEDELISRIRMESLIWATLVNYFILAFAVMFFYTIAFLQVLIFNMFTTLLFFIIRFRWMMYKSKKQISNEE